MVEAARPTTSALPAAYRAKVWRESWTNFSVVRHGQFHGVLVTSKNSGTHWIKYMLAVALADTHGIQRPAYFSEDAVRPYIGWPKDRPAFASLPRLAFCHSIPHAMSHWPVARAALRLPPYVLAVRHPMAILSSHYDKWKDTLGVDWRTYLEGDAAGKRFRCDLYWIARFWNRWGQLQAEYPQAILRVTYEETLHDPRGVIEAIAAHFDLKLTPASIEAALHAGTKAEMAKHVDPDAEPNVLQNRADDLAARFNGEALEIYAAHVRTLFRHTLGYNLLSVPSDITA